MIQDRNKTGVSVDTDDTVLEEFHPNGHFYLDIELSGMGNSGTFAVEVTDDDETSWEEGKEYSSVTSISDVLEGVASKVRVRVKTGASNGTTADYYMGAGD